MTELNEKIRAGRALLGWNLENLQDDSGVEKRTINQIEVGKSKPKQETIDKLEASLNRHGVFFTQDGVEKRSSYTREFTGINWYIDMLDDLLARKPDKVVFFYADERQSPPAVVERMRKAKEMGIRSRLFIEEGNTFIQGNLEDYRYIPSDLFDNYYFLVYGDYVGLCDEDRGTLITNPRLARNWKSIADIMWRDLEQPTKSTADVRI